MYSKIMGHDRNRKEWIDYLCKNKREKWLYTVTKYDKMDIRLYTTESCSKCNFIKPKIAELCDKNGWDLEMINAEEIDSGFTSIPMMEVNGEILDYDGIIQFYLNNK